MIPKSNGRIGSGLRFGALWPLALLALAAVWMGRNAPYPLERAQRAIAFPYQLDAEEGFLLNQALRLRAGAGLYGPIDSEPYLVDNYPPLYPAFWSFFADPAAPELAVGRWIAALSALATALALGLLIAASAPRVAGRTPTQRAVTRAAALLLAWYGAIGFLTTYATLRWMAYARVDLLAIALSVWGLAFFSLWGRREGAWRGRAAAIVCFALALLTKQTSLAAPTACLLWLALRERRAVLWFALGLVAAADVPVAMLCLRTDGEYWRHTVTYNRNVMHWNEMASWVRHLWRFYAPLLSVAALLALWLARRAWSRTAPESPLGLYAAYFGLNAIGLGALAKAGAAENYLIEFHASLALFVGAGLCSLVDSPPAARRTVSRACLTALALALLAFHAWRYSGSAQLFYYSAPSPTVQALNQGDRVVRMARERGGPILTEDPIYALRAGLPVLFQNFIMTELTAEGKWDETDIVARAKRGEFSLVVAHQDLDNPDQFFNRYSPALRQAIAARYRLAAKLERDGTKGEPFPPLQTIYVYEPRSAGE